MDLYKIIGWSIFILILAAFVIFFQVRSRKRNSRKLAVLHSFASENNCTISTYDSWENTLLGISNPERNTLFFIRSTPGGEIRQIINLSEVAECRIFKTERKIEYNKELVNVIDKIELRLSFSHAKPPVSLEFYNVDYDNLTLTGELQLAQKWTEMIKSNLPLNRSKKNIGIAKINVKKGNNKLNTVLPRRAG